MKWLLNKLKCRLQGHKWGKSHLDAIGIDGPMWRKTCRVCNAQAPVRRRVRPQDVTPSMNENRSEYE